MDFAPVHAEKGASDVQAVVVGDQRKRKVVRAITEPGPLRAVLPGHVMRRVEMTRQYIQALGHSRVSAR